MAPIEPQEIHVNWLNQHADPLTKQMGSMYQCIERYILQQLNCPNGGRGLTLQHVYRPIHDASKSWFWRKGNFAYWNQIEFHLQQLLHQDHREAIHQTLLQKLGWKLEEHWFDMPRILCQDFHMLFDMLWHQHGDEHIHVLLNFAQTQRELHQAESFLLENKDWQKGLEPWGAIWQIQNQSVLIGYLEKLIEKGQ